MLIFAPGSIFLDCDDWNFSFNRNNYSFHTPCGIREWKKKCPLWNSFFCHYNQHLLSFLLMTSLHSQVLNVIFKGIFIIFLYILLVKRFKQLPEKIWWVQCISWFIIVFHRPNEMRLLSGVVCMFGLDFQELLFAFK